MRGWKHPTTLRCAASTDSQSDDTISEPIRLKLFPLRLCWILSFCTIYFLPLLVWPPSSVNVAVLLLGALSSDCCLNHTTYTILRYTTLLCCTVLYYILHCTTPFYIVLHYATVPYTIVHYITSQTPNGLFDPPPLATIYACVIC